MNKLLKCSSGEVWHGIIIKAEHLWLKHPVIAQQLYRPITLLGTNTAINCIIILAIVCM